MDGNKIKILISVAVAVVVAALAVFMMNNSYEKKIAEKVGEALTASTTSPSSTSTNPATLPETSSTQVKRPQKDVEILVNSENPIPENWSVNIVNLRNNQQVDRRAYEDLQKMMDDARAQGYNPYICSSYRTNETQTRLYNNKVSEYINLGYSRQDAEKEAGKWVAYPGTSEHQLGFALDIVSVENQSLDESQLNSKCQQWLMKNCYDYGFILRYPENKTDITKIGFEPWHYRYVGHEAAKIIKEQGLCLEEYVSEYLS